MGIVSFENRRFSIYHPYLIVNEGMDAEEIENGWTYYLELKNKEEKEQQKSLRSMMEICFSISIIIHFHFFSSPNDTPFEWNVLVFLHILFHFIGIAMLVMRCGSIEMGTFQNVLRYFIWDKFPSSLTTHNALLIFPGLLSDCRGGLRWDKLEWDWERHN